MGMLANLLPGIRELRAPLAAGYLWLVALWFALESRIPSRGHATGHFHVVYRFLDVATIFGKAVVVTFAAYLIGSLSATFLNGPLKLVATVVFLVVAVVVVLPWLVIEKVSEKIGFPIIGSGLDDVLSLLLGEREDVSNLSKGSEREVRLLAERQLRQIEAKLKRATLDAFELYDAQSPNRFPEEMAPGEHGSLDDKIDHYRTQTVRLVLRELDLVRTRLLGKDPAMFSAVDREKAEAELRLAIVPPLVTLLLVMAVTWSPWWATGLAAAAGIYVQGLMREQAASQLLADALVLERVQAPRIQNLSAATNEAIEPAKAT